MKQDNQQELDAHRAMADAAIAVLDTRFLKALTDVTRVQIVKKLILLGTCRRSRARSICYFASFEHLGASPHYAIAQSWTSSLPFD